MSHSLQKLGHSVCSFYVPCKRQNFPILMHAHAQVFCCRLPRKFYISTSSRDWFCLPGIRSLFFSSRVFTYFYTFLCAYELKLFLSLIHLRSTHWYCCLQGSVVCKKLRKSLFPSHRHTNVFTLREVLEISILSYRSASEKREKTTCVVGCPAVQLCVNVPATLRCGKVISTMAVRNSRSYVCVPTHTQSPAKTFLKCVGSETVYVIIVSLPKQCVLVLSFQIIFIPVQVHFWYRKSAKQCEY